MRIKSLCLLSVLLLAFVGCGKPKAPFQPKPLPPAPVFPPDEKPDERPIFHQQGPTDPSKITEYTPSGSQPPPRNGNFGYFPNPEGTREFLRTLPKPTLREANPALFAPDGPMVQEVDNPQTAKEPVLLYRALYAINPNWKVGRQGIGDCVSWGWAHGCDIALAVDYLTGKTGEWKPAATEAIYGGSRVEGRGKPEGSGGWGDGSYGGAAARFVSKFGVVYRRPFPDFGYDLTRYDKSRAKSWGNWGCGGEGDRGRLDAWAKRHPVGQVALVRNFEEAAAAIESGYPVPVCSGRGFSSTRDKDGFCRPSGSWSHCMCFISVRYDRPGLLCLNSWGTDYVSGPKWPPDQPDGSFWVDASVATGMLNGEDSFAVAEIKGFPRRKLLHALGW